MQVRASRSEMDIEASKKLMNVAMGLEPADLAIINTRLLNVYTGELLDNYSVCTCGKWIAYVGDRPKSTIGKTTEVIDAAGGTLIPGFIDGHAHLAWLCTASELLKYIITGGTTTIITETLEAFPLAGYDGIIDFLASFQTQPIKIYATAPPLVSISQKTRGISIEALRQLLIREDVLGLGESYWQAVLQEPDWILPLIKETLDCGKSLEGHSAGTNHNKLMAYVTTGISSCHEPIKAEDVLERLRLGLHVMIREGSIRRDLEKISKIKNAGINLRRLSLVTDGVDPRDLMEKGYMEYLVQKAIDCGFDPISAVQMATLNVAEHFSLDGIIGGIAPGRYADILMIPDLKTIEPQYVISNGQMVARKGKLQVQPRPHVFSDKSLKTIHLPRPLKPSDFSIRVETGASEITVRIIELITDLVTKEATATLPVVNGEIKPDVRKDLLKVAAIDITHSPGKIFTGLLKGFCLNAGAVASSGAWDTTDIIVVGTNAADMATAVNRIYELQGGAIVCQGGKILAELPMPILGIISDLPIETIVNRLHQIKSALSDLGTSLQDPWLTLITLTCAAIPYLKICEEGLVNLKDGKTLGLFMD